MMLIGVLAGLLVVNAAVMSAVAVVGRSLVRLVGAYLDTMRDVLEKAELERYWRAVHPSAGFAPEPETASERANGERVLTDLEIAEGDEFTFLPPRPFPQP